MKRMNVLRAGLIAASLAASNTLLAAAPSLTTETAVGKLELPWDMAFLKDGTMFFTEKCMACRSDSQQARSISYTASEASPDIHPPALTFSVMVKPA